MSSIECKARYTNIYYPGKNVEYFFLKNIYNKMIIKSKNIIKMNYIKHVIKIKHKNIQKNENEK